MDSYQELSDFLKPLTQTGEYFVTMYADDENRPRFFQASWSLAEVALKRASFGHEGYVVRVSWSTVRGVDEENAAAFAKDLNSSIALAASIIAFLDEHGLQGYQS